MIDVHACAVNFPDVLIIQNLYQFKPAAPVLTRCRGGGHRELGRRRRQRDRGRRPGARLDRLGRPRGEGWRSRPGSCIPVPDGIDLVHALGLPLRLRHIAARACPTAAKLQAGEVLLVLGAAGGVGLAAVELGALAGATVIAAASSDEKLALCREYGAVHTINYAHRGSQGSRPRAHRRSRRRRDL